MIGLDPELDLLQPQQQLLARRLLVVRWPPSKGQHRELPRHLGSRRVAKKRRLALGPWRREALLLTLRPLLDSLSGQWHRALCV